jgi:hypothetical protein
VILELTDAERRALLVAVDHRIRQLESNPDSYVQQSLSKEDGALAKHMEALLSVYKRLEQ